MGTEPFTIIDNSIKHVHQGGYELLIGSGNNLAKQVVLKGDDKEWKNVVTLDMDWRCNPDILWNLEDLPLPIADHCFQEIHAYEVLEHLGRQGDWKSFFDIFAEFHRILKTGGYVIGTTPMWDSKWAWGDPGHTRIISTQSLVFLSQAEYEGQVGKGSPMTDYRHYYKADFAILDSREVNDHHVFVLQAK